MLHFPATSVYTRDTTKGTKQMREDLRQQRRERYNNRNNKIKEVKKLGEMRRERAIAFRNHRDIWDIDPLEWMD
ncbi:hypothetical protein SEA_SPILLED_14 [Streptomyces phage Spilled]|nr:hypothetical protein SEA_BIRCHLYN_272 [Streptomyces phage Birchlyn]UVK59918.1 hypothetical protein SEA_SPILLED_14 [Streptomyces phage Spilled]UVK61085.1 hypothetical protein SEA_JIMJAM_283 [Streptomyces phage JimJam]